MIMIQIKLIIHVCKTGPWHSCFHCHFLLYLFTDFPVQPVRC